MTFFDLESNAYRSNYLLKVAILGYLFAHSSHESTEAASARISLCVLRVDHFILMYHVLINKLILNDQLMLLSSGLLSSSLASWPIRCVLSIRSPVKTKQKVGNNIMVSPLAFFNWASAKKLWPILEYKSRVMSIVPRSGTPVYGAGFRFRIINVQRTVFLN